MNRISLIVAILTIPASAGAQEMTWVPRPTFRVGETLLLEPHVKLQGALRWFPTELAPDDGTFAMGRRRVSVEGTLFKHLDFEIEREFQGDGLWTDVYVDFTYLPYAQLQAGKFKVPFSLEQTSGAFSLDFVQRTILARDLALGRDTGAMLHGRVLDDQVALSYQVGLFRHDGERSRFGNNPGAGTTFAGRVRAQPLRRVTRDAPLSSLQVGLATTMGDVPEGPGPNSLRARTLAGRPILYPVYVNGRRTRLGAEASWEPGPFSLRSELIQIWDERLGQGLAGEDLPRLSIGGWYVSGSWVITGERKAGGVEPARPFPGGGPGALELAARYEHVRLGADDSVEPPTTNPRGTHLVEIGSGATTVGVNWYLNRWGKVQFNLIRESFDDPERSPIPGRSGFWSGLCQLQFVL